MSRKGEQKEKLRFREIPCPDPEEMVQKGPTHYYIVERVSDGKEVGSAEIRLALNEYMRKFGGNLGYFINPEERQKGYGSETLAKLLVKCREAGLKVVLITCYEDNLPSKKMIEKAGGVLDGIAADEQGKILRYRIGNKVEKEACTLYNEKSKY